MSPRMSRVCGTPCAVAAVIASLLIWSDRAMATEDAAAASPARTHAAHAAAGSVDGVAGWFTPFMAGVAQDPPCYRMGHSIAKSAIIAIIDGTLNDAGVRVKRSTPISEYAGDAERILDALSLWGIVVPPGLIEPSTTIQDVADYIAEHLAARYVGRGSCDLGLQVASWIHGRELAEQRATEIYSALYPSSTAVAARLSYLGYKAGTLSLASVRLMDGTSRDRSTFQSDSTVDEQIQIETTLQAAISGTYTATLFAYNGSASETLDTFTVFLAAGTPSITKRPPVSASRIHKNFGHGTFEIFAGVEFGTSRWDRTDTQVRIARLSIIPANTSPRLVVDGSSQGAVLTADCVYHTADGHAPKPGLVSITVGGEAVPHVIFDQTAERPFTAVYRAASTRAEGIYPITCHASDGDTTVTKTLSYRHSMTRPVLSLTAPTTGTTGSALELTATLRDGVGGMPGEIIHFSTAGAGRFVPVEAAATTDAEGVARISFLPTAAGAHQFTAWWDRDTAATGDTSITAGEADAAESKVNAIVRTAGACVNTVPADRWKGEYFSNNSLTGSPVMVLDHGTGEFGANWGDASPGGACGVPADHFSLRLTRRVNFAAGRYRIFGLSDDGVRLYVDGELKFSDWNARAAEWGAEVELTAGDHDLRVEYFDNGGGASLSVTWIKLFEPGCIQSVTADRWKGEYFSNKTLSGSPVMVRDHGTGSIAFNWIDQSPSSACGVPMDNFSLRLTRRMNFAAGLYRFSGLSDDGVRLYIDGELKFSDWNPRAGAWSVEVDVPVGDHDVRVEYFDNGGLASLSVSRTETGCIRYDSTGWRGEYFSNKTLGGFPVMVQDYGTGSIAFNWAAGTPSSACGVPADNFSLRLTRRVNLTAGLYRFSGVSDDGIRLYIDGELIFSDWNPRAAVWSVDTNLAAGYHDVQVEYFENGGAASLSVSWTRLGELVCFETVPADRWKGEYFNNKTVSGSPVLVRDHGAGTIDFNWGLGSPGSACGVPADNFSLRLTRRASFTAGLYRFSGVSDDGVRLYIDNNLRFSDWNPRAAVWSAELDVGAGDHDVRIEHFDNGGGASLTVSWVKTREFGCFQNVTADRWKGEYFSNKTLSGSPVMVADHGTGNIALNWVLGSPSTVCGVPAESFSVRLTRRAEFTAGRYRFSGVSDDGVRLYVDNELKFSDWNPRAAAWSADVDLPAGVHEVRVEYFENGGGASLSVSWVKFAEFGCTQAVAADRWKGEYFGNNTLTGAPVMVQDHGTGDIAFNWVLGSPSGACGVPADNFSLRLTRRVNFSAGRYRFSGVSDDGVRLYVDNQLKFSDWNPRAAVWSAEVDLPAGDHDVRVEYFDNGGGASLTVSWTRLGDPGCIQTIAANRWKGEYFSNQTLSGSPVMVQDHGTGDIAFNWGLASPSSACGIPADSFSLRLTRRAYFAAGHYRFSGVSDDGVAVYVDNRVQFIDWNPRANSWSVDLYMPAGDHDVRVDYFDSGGGASLTVSWVPI